MQLLPHSALAIQASWHDSHIRSKHDLFGSASQTHGWGAHHRERWAALRSLTSKKARLKAKQNGDAAGPWHQKDANIWVFCTLRLSMAIYHPDLVQTEFPAANAAHCLPKVLAPCHPCCVTCIYWTLMPLATSRLWHFGFCGKCACVGVTLSCWIIERPWRNSHNLWPISTPCNKSTPCNMRAAPSNSGAEVAIVKSRSCTCSGHLGEPQKLHPDESGWKH